MTLTAFLQLAVVIILLNQPTAARRLGAPRNECHFCHKFATCLSTTEGFACKCNDGYEQKGKRACVPMTSHNPGVDLPPHSQGVGHQDETGNQCQVLATADATQVASMLNPITEECLDYCIDQDKSCSSGSNDCSGECLACVDKNSTMSLDIHLHFVNDIFEHMVTHNTRALNISRDEYLESVYPILNESYPELFGLLGSNVTLRLCMNDIEVLVKNGSNSSSLYHTSNNHGTVNNPDLSFCGSATSHMDYFGTFFETTYVLNTSELKYFTYPQRVRMTTSTKLDTSGTCEMVSVKLELPMVAGASLSVGGGNATDNLTTIDVETPVWKPGGVFVSAYDYGCNQQYTYLDDYVTLPGRRDLEFRQGSDPDRSPSMDWQAWMYHPLFDPPPNDDLSIENRVLRFQIRANVDYIRINHDGCVPRRTICFHDDKNWQDVSMSESLVSMFLQEHETAILGSCEDNQVAVCNIVCGTAPSCQVPVCTSQKLTEGSTNSTYSFSCDFQERRCPLSDKPYETDDSVMFECNVETDECEISCPDDTVCHKFPNSNDQCLCQSCVVPSNLLVEIDTSLSYIRYYTINMDGVGTRVRNRTDEISLHESLKSTIPELYEIDIGQQIVLSVCVGDLMDYKSSSSSTATEFKWLRDYRSFDATHPSCPGLGFGVSSYPSLAIFESYNAAHDGVAFYNDSDVRGLHISTDNRYFRIDTEHTMTSDGVCLKRGVSANFGVGIPTIAATDDTTNATRAPFWFPMHNTLSENGGSETSFSVHNSPTCSLFEVDEGNYTFFPQEVSVTPQTAGYYSGATFHVLICNAPEIQSLPMIVESPGAYFPCVRADFIVRKPSLIKYTPQGCG